MDEQEQGTGQESLVEITASIVAAHVSNNHVAVGDVAGLVQQVHRALSSLGEGGEEKREPKTPAVSKRASVKPDYIVCMECGKKQKMLKRHIQTAHGMSPAEYRQEYGLSAHYPMVAPNYSETRRDLAHKIGLGTKRKGSGEGSSAGNGKSKPKGNGKGAKAAPKGRKKAETQQEG